MRNIRTRNVIMRTLYFLNTIFWWNNGYLHDENETLWLFAGTSLWRSWKRRMQAEVTFSAHSSTRDSTREKGEVHRTQLTFRRFFSVMHDWPYWNNQFAANVIHSHRTNLLLVCDSLFRHDDILFLCIRFKSVFLNGSRPNLKSCISDLIWSWFVFCNSS